MSRVLPALLDRRLEPAVAVRVVERRSLTARLTAIRGGRDVQMVASIYWPIAVIEARASSTGRRRWTEHTTGAIDLISGRIGIVDEEVPRQHDVSVDPETVIPTRLSRADALADWHDYFRDYLDRRRRPLRPPALSVDRIEPLWVEHQLVQQGEQRFLVDPVTRRADPLDHFPSVAQSMKTMKDQPTCKV